MKTTTSVFAAFFFISILLISCHKDSDVLNRTFSKVEEYMDICPDTALYILNSIPNPENLHGKAGADYALLMTEAMDKNYMKFSSDSLMVLALEYYMPDKREPFMRAKAQFYYGRVLLESDKAEEALGYLYMQMGRIQDARKYLKLSMNATHPYTRIDAYTYLYFLNNIYILLIVR